MPKAIITEQYLTDIANAIRTKTGETTSYTPPEMANKILTIPSGGGSTPVLQNKTHIPTETTTTITADSGYDGLGVVTVNGITPTYIGSQVPFITYYSDEGEPSQSLGQNGDIYLELYAPTNTNEATE